MESEPKRRRKTVKPDVIDRLPPHSPEAEQGILGCIMLSPADCMPQCQQRLKATAECFYDLRHQTIYRQLLEMWKRGVAIEVITLQQCLKDLHRLDECGGISYLAQLPDTVPSSANLSYYLDIVCEKYRLRKLISTITTIAARAQDCSDVDLMMDESRAELLTLFESSAIGDIPKVEDAADFTAFDLEQPKQIVCGVLHAGGKLAIGGGSKTFKTWTLLDMGLAVAHGKPWLGFNTTRAKVCYINLELQPWSFQRRLNAVAKQREIVIEDGWFDVWNLRGHANGYTQLLPIFAQEIARRQSGLLIIDPVYKLYGDADENSASDVSALLNGFEMLAQKTKAAIAFASHFSKGNQSGKEAIDRISGSGVFARDPDAILTFTKHEEENAFVVDSTLRDCAQIQPFVVRWEYPLMRRDGDLDPTKLKQPRGRPATHKAEALLSHLPADGISATAWQKAVCGETGMSRAKFYEFKRVLEQLNVVKADESGNWKHLTTIDKEDVP